MRDYGGDIPCPFCGHKHHVTPRQLQTEFQIVFICDRCGAEVMHDNDVAREIAETIERLRPGFEKMKL